MGMNNDDHRFLADRMDELRSQLGVISMALVSISQGEKLWDADAIEGRTVPMQYRPWIVRWRKMRDRVLLTKDSFDMKWSE